MNPKDLFLKYDPEARVLHVLNPAGRLTRTFDPGETLEDAIKEMMQAFSTSGVSEAELPAFEARIRSQLFSETSAN